MQQRLFFIINLIALSAIFKIVPHLPNFSPELVFAGVFGATFSKRMQFFLILMLLIICDALFAAVSPYPVFGSWLGMTYSGFLCIGFAAGLMKIQVQRWQFVGFSVVAACAFWVWTNFLVWLTMGMYPHTASGLFVCFAAALPFLSYALLAAIFWSTLVKYLSGCLASGRFLRKKLFCV